MFKTKRDIRTHALLSRNKLTNRAEKSKQISDIVLNLKEWYSSEVICTYLSVRSEVDTSIIVKEILIQKKTLVVPWSKPEKNLGLCIIKSLNELSPGKFGVMEPIKSLREDKTRKPDFSIIPFAIIPGIAFDHNKNRLGYGKGYYDKLLAELPQKCFKVGLCFQSQIYPEIPTEKHDIKVDLLISESGILT